MSSYIQELRKKVGNQPLILIGATILVFDDKNRILFQLRTDSMDWGLPGGAMEIGESLEETASRELFEETGLKPTKLKLLNVFSGKDFYHVYPSGEETYCVIVLYKAMGVTGDLKINDNESIDLKYFFPEEVPVIEKRAKLVLKKLNYLTGAP